MNNEKHFIRQIIEQDIASGKHGGCVVTRFPPEPNGYLHIGHAKAICLDFGMALEYNGRCHLRMDDTNPTKESEEYVEAIKRDVRWLGFDWGEHFYYAADYFDRMYQVAEDLIRRGKAYVCALTAEQWKEYRGSPPEPGKPSPWRDRPAAESLELFRRMRAGEFPDGSLCLRAKIDMTSPNIQMRDPVLYRIMRVPHYRTGTKWCIYPTYDFAHPLEDAFEGITHSLCTLEFEVHRPLYDWVIEQLDLPYRPRQYEFARLNLSYTVMSKRLLQELVSGGYVEGWDDPRLPTLAGLRRRGYTPEAIRTFCEMVGVTKVESMTDMALLEFCIREDLNQRAERRMAVLRPLRLVIDNYPEGQEEELEAANNPERPEAGVRKVPFSRVLYIEKDDFREDPPKAFFRLAPGQEVRLRYAYYVKCTGVVKDQKTGEVVEVHCTYDPASRGGGTPDGRRVKGTIHWVSAKHAERAEVRLYDRLFTVPDPLADKDRDYKTFLNPASLQTATAFAEPSLRNALPGEYYQFERLGYFFVDPVLSRPGEPVFNRTVTLRDTWAKIEKRLQQ
ncbi:MAG: glutamine--tRNA ligase/YqeY domain fusion protein [Kiritimatiellia bacterium]